MVRFGVLVTRAKGEEMLRNRGGQTRGIKEGSVGEKLYPRYPRCLDHV